ncbi:hypothetical protein [Enterococcus sp. AZ109]|uniref:hypothetical protein n=1 Tax=Enterococcus sp. AZ109 TaxID=2774634 RepID=UPI003F2940E1
MKDEKKTRVSELYDALVEPEVEPDQLTIKEKEILHADEAAPPSKKANNLTAKEKPISHSALSYYDNRESNYQDILTLIDDAEKELTDLKFRKKLMESDFPTLLKYFREIFLKAEYEVSAIAKGALLEYFTFELLKPLESKELRLSSNDFSTWETKHYTLSYRLVKDQVINFHLMMPTSDGKIRTEKIHLMAIYPETMRVVVLNNAVLTLLEDCYQRRIYSSGQNSLLSHEMNSVFSHMKYLGFALEDNLLDNSQPLSLSFDLPHMVSTDTLDDIFITAMNNPKYDFKKPDEEHYLVLLENNHSVEIVQDKEKNITRLKLDTANSNKSLIEFFGAYPFLVSLALK